jgi:hypothetical protein
VNDNDNIKKLNNKDVVIKEINGFLISKIINSTLKHGYIASHFIVFLIM